MRFGEETLVTEAGHDEHTRTKMKLEILENFRILIFRSLAAHLNHVSHQNRPITMRQHIKTKRTVFGQALVFTVVPFVA